MRTVNRTVSRRLLPSAVVVRRTRVSAGLHAVQVLGPQFKGQNLTLNVNITLKPIKVYLKLHTKEP